MSNENVNIEHRFDDNDRLQYAYQAIGQTFAESDEFIRLRNIHIAYDNLKSILAKHEMEFGNLTGEVKKPALMHINYSRLKLANALLSRVYKVIQSLDIPDNVKGDISFDVTEANSAASRVKVELRSLHRL